MKVLYMLSAMFPFGRAYASRVMNLCLALTAKGYDVDVLADYISDPSLLDPDGIGHYRGVRIFLTTAHPAAERTLTDKLTVSLKAKRALKAYLKSNRPDCVMMSSASDRFMPLSKIVKRHRIPLLLESCEWFDSYNWDWGKWDPRYHQFLRFWDRSPHIVDGVIAISRLLQEHYGRYVPTIRIPGLADPDAITREPHERHDKIRLVFAGEIVCGKDDVSEAIRAVADAHLEDQFEIHVFGPNSAALEQQLGESLPPFVSAYGFVKQEEMLSRLKTMDFGLLIRPDRRSSHAGFPTKLVEYLSQGLPVIANLTGDIGLYLKDGENGYIAENNDRAALTGCLKRVAAEYSARYEEMSRAAVLTAFRSFDYHLYADSLDELVHHCLGESY